MTSADSTSPHQNLDCIRITGISALGYHGVLQSEREEGQTFSADLELGINLSAAARGDDLTQTANYAHVAEAVVSVLAGPPVNLIETVAERIAAIVLENPLVQTVSVTIHKPSAPIPVPFDGVEVTVIRSRTNMPVVARPFVEVGEAAVQTLPSWSDVDQKTSDEPTSNLDKPADTEFAQTTVHATAPIEDEPHVAGSENVDAHPEPSSAEEPSLERELSQTMDEEASELTDSESTHSEPVGHSPGSEPESAPHAVVLPDKRDEPTVEVVEPEDPEVAESALDHDDLLLTQSAAEGPTAQTFVEQHDRFFDVEPPSLVVVTEPTRDPELVLPSAPTLDATSPAFAPSVGSADEIWAPTFNFADSPTVKRDLDAEPDFTVQPTPVFSSQALKSPAQAVSPVPMDEDFAPEPNMVAGADNTSVQHVEVGAPHYQWQQSHASAVVSGPTLSELLGGSQYEPLDLSKPLFAISQAEELAPLPKPFFEKPEPVQVSALTSSQQKYVSVDSDANESAVPEIVEAVNAVVAPLTSAIPVVTAIGPDNSQSDVSTGNVGHTSSDGINDNAIASVSESNALATESNSVEADGAENVQGTSRLSESAQARLEERFAAMMSEHFGIDVNGANQPSESNSASSTVSSPVDAPNADAQHTSQDNSEGLPNSGFADAATMAIPLISADDRQLSLGADRPGRASAVVPELKGASSVFATLDQMDEQPEAPVRVVLALGANLGDAQSTLISAVHALGMTEGFRIVKVGPLALTAAVGGPEQNDYYNSVVVGETVLSPRDLLHATQAIENANNRIRDVRWGPRTLDIDIVTYGQLVASSADLEIPHPRAKERAFVLVPWEEADPEAFLPGLGGGPVKDLAATAPDRSGMRWLALNWLT